MAGKNPIAEKIKEIADRDLTFMHVCGTHEAAIARHGIRTLLPKNLKIVMGPGCPVCITPQGEIDAALELGKKGCIIATYGDLLRVPGTKGSLESLGADVRVVQGVHKAVEIAMGTDKEVVFISVGFETTAPTVAAILLANPPKNFSILCCHRLIPPAMEWLLSRGEATLDGFLLPGHVLTVTGLSDYKKFKIPQIVAGFDPDDILLGILMLIEQVKKGTNNVENAYPRAVSEEGNPRAMDMLFRIFETCDSEWRGFPVIPASGLRVREEYSNWDAQKKFDVKIKPTKKNSACICDKVLRGIASPSDCKLFDTICSPRNPVGPCMVSHEGACRIWNQYKQPDY